MRYIVLLALGIAIGYAYGFSDAKTHDQNVVERMLNHAGGSTRGDIGTDVDSTMNKLEKP